MTFTKGRSAGTQLLKYISLERVGLTLCFIVSKRQAAEIFLCVWLKWMMLLDHRTEKSFMRASFSERGALKKRYRQKEQGNMPRKKTNFE